MLLRASVTSGDCIVRTEPPRVDAYFDAQVVPLPGFPDTDPDWGVYRADGLLVETAAYKRGPGRRLVGQSDRMTRDHDFERVRAPMIYGGCVQIHFGHYLLSVLSRYWVDLRLNFPGAKILVHAPVTLEQWFARPFVRETLAALGYGPADFVVARRPMRVDHLIVPEASFTELSSVHRVFGDLGRRVGEAIDHAPPPQWSTEPVYLSKERLRSGVWRLVNETEMVDVLRRGGVRIVYPEELTLREQIRVFAEHETVAGLMGSALHTTLLTRGGNRLIGLRFDDYVPSNFLLLDWAKDNRSEYYYPRGKMRDLGGNERFQSEWIMEDPRGVGSALLDLIA